MCRTIWNAVLPIASAVKIPGGVVLWCDEGASRCVRVRGARVRCNERRHSPGGMYTRRATELRDQRHAKHSHQPTNCFQWPVNAGLALMGGARARAFRLR